MVSHGGFGPIIRSGLPRGASLGGLKARRDFISALLQVAPDTRQLWVPLGADTTTSTSVDDNARTITWNATIAAQYRTVGSGYFVTFDGSTDNGTSPDAASMTFGNGTTDEPFSIYAWVRMTANTAVKTIIARHDLTTGATNLEWSFHFDASELLVGQVFDDSVGTDVRVGRSFGTALPTGTDMLVVMTYSGSGTNAGIRLFAFDGTNSGQVDDTDAGNGAYVAMEDQAALTYIGAREGTGGTATEFFNGSMGAIGVVSGELSADEIQVIRQLGNGYYGLTV